MTHVQPRNLNLLRTLVGPQPDALMSARNLARRTEIHHSFVSLILSGKRTRVSADIATRIAAALGVKPAVLFRPAPTNTKRIGVKRGGEK